MKMFKAQGNLRMKWENDIPTPDYKLQWQDICWKEVNRRVYKLQKRIYKASQRGDVETVRGLQKILMKSQAGKLLATRRITQENQGRKTAGIDGVKSLSPKKRIEATKNLKLTDKCKPVRRVWIPKPGRNEERPLGIPTIHERIKQYLVKMALEPEWEAKFEPNSYGFRPGRSTYDAITAIYGSISKKPKYVLDADIASCFDRINHKELLNKLNTTPEIRRQIKAWLKSGVLDNHNFQKTIEGVPQGGAISPLLANIALHGLEEVLNQTVISIPQKYPNGKSMARKDKISALSVVRYADDFAILHPRLDILQKCKEVAENWLRNIGLELKPSKTQVVHTLYEHEGKKPGFDFLGFNLRQYPRGKHRSAHKSGGEALGFVTRTRPSKKAVLTHYRKLADIITKHNPAPAKTLIARLNPIIRGWTNYFSLAESHPVFRKLDHLLFRRLFRWAKRRHKNKGTTWRVEKYWTHHKGNNWVFFDKVENGDKIHLLYHDWTPTVNRYVKIKDTRSPYDGDTIYWSKRMGKHPEINTREAKLLKKQNGRCKHCKIHFKDGNRWEVDHILAKALGGADSYNNLQLLHKYCHDIKTAQDMELIKIHKAAKQYNKFLKSVTKEFLEGKWQWVNDVPLHKVYECQSPYLRGAV